MESSLIESSFMEFSVNWAQCELLWESMKSIDDILIDSNAFPSFWFMTNKPSSRIGWKRVRVLINQGAEAEDCATHLSMISQ